jgi:NAD-dependent DNA ligase
MRIEIPKNCPCCNYPLELVNDQLFCRNQACDAQLNKKLEHFCKTLGMKGFGSKTIEKLQLSDITELFSLCEDSLFELLGSEKIAKKLAAEIEQAKLADLATVLASFSIPLIGNTASKKISSTVNNVDEINAETCVKAGLGEKATTNLLEFLSRDLPEMKQFLPFSFVSKIENNADNTSGMSVCVTGKLKTFKTKADAYLALKAAGYKVVESVTKTLDYLVDEENKGSTKRTKADTLGIKIISNLETFLKENTND